MLALIAASAGACPHVQTVGTANFSLNEWVRKTWYIQEQQIVDYQPLSSFYCVAATYNLEGATVPFGVTHFLVPG